MNRYPGAALLAAALPLAAGAADLLLLPSAAVMPHAGAAVRFPGSAGALLHLRGLAILVDPVPGAAALPADLVLTTQPPAWRAPPGNAQPLPLWQAVTVRRGRTRLRVTALPDLQGREGALMLDFGPACRVFVHGAAVDGGDIGRLPGRYPGATLALLRDAGGSLLMTVAPDGSAATLQRQAPFRLAPACAAKAG